MKFSYAGINREGKSVRGELDAPNEGELRMQLRTQGIRPKKIREQSAGIEHWSKNLFQPKIQSKQIVHLTRQLHVLISSGVPLLQSLDVLVEQEDPGPMKNSLLKIHQSVSAGTPFWESCQQQVSVFPKIFLSLMRAGESSGSFDSMLQRTVKYLEDAERMTRIIKGAMVYPIIVILIAIGVVTAMLAFVVPKFQELLSGSSQELPAPTRFLINSSQFLQDNWHILGLVIFAGGAFIKQSLAQPEGKVLLQRIIDQVPYLGTLTRRSAVARFSKTMATLLQSGITLNEALEICRHTLNHPQLEASMLDVKKDVESGAPLAQSLQKLEQMPRMMIQMIAVGESTGSLDKMFEKIGEYYDAEVEAGVLAMTKLIEPVILLVLGGLVAGILASMYLPIFQMASGADG